MAELEPFISTVSLWPLDWAPAGWAICNGQILNVAQNQALFSLLGSRYGGNGQTTFGLPDLRGRVPIGMGAQPGGQNYAIGTVGGRETYQLAANNVPAHTHTATGSVAVKASNGRPDQSSPQNNYICAKTDSFSSSSDTCMAASPVTVTIQTTPNNLPFSVVQPYQVLNYIIAVQGAYPSRQ